MDTNFVTNILVTLTFALSTNVQERFPQHLVADPQIIKPGQGIVDAVFYGHYENDENPKEKWLITNVSQSLTFHFKWGGEDHGWTEEKSLTNWSTHFVKREGWDLSTNSRYPSLDWESPQFFNTAHPPSGLWPVTNHLIATNILWTNDNTQRKN